MKGLADPAQQEAIIGSVPLHRMGSVDEMGQITVFLASPLASYASGCFVVCDGGQNLVGSALFNIGAVQALEAQAKG
jgi:NAD(P)-dependent dehydrogenase (short-subunit alcohol dehydrogenase family)